MRTLIILVALAATAHAQPAPPGPSQGGEWYGYENIAAGVAFGALGALGSEADMSRDNHIAAASLTLAVGIAASPGIHYLNDGLRMGKLRLSEQLTAGGALAGFGIGCLLEYQAYDKDHMHSFDWSQVGFATFVGLAIGSAADGFVLGHKSAGTAAAMNVAVLPDGRGGTTVAVAGRF